MVRLGERIKEARREKNLFQFQLAEVLKVPQSTVSKWERSVIEPSAEMIVKIAVALDCDPNYLLAFGE